MLSMGSGKKTNTLTGSVASAANLIESTPVEDYASLSVQITGAAGATTSIVVEVSNDNANWVATRMQNVADATALAGALAATAVGPIHRGPLVARFMRVRCNVYAASGTVAVVVFLSSDVFTSVVKST